MDNLLNKEPIKRVEKVLGQFDQSIKIQILDKTARTAKDAAESLKTEVGSIVKSLLLRTKTSFLLCLVAGDKRCSLNKVKKLLNQKDVSMANAEQVKKITGFTIGGVSPVAHLNKVDIVTIGQYLSPGPKHLPVNRFVSPSQFDSYRIEGENKLGFLQVISSPLTRSSYHAGEVKKLMMSHPR